jgi:hypothetical protein
MFKTNATFRKWHVIGFFWIVIVGSLLHFTYEWSGKVPIVGYFSPVNESVWEHLKLGYFSLTFFMLIDFWVLRNKTTGYFAAKAAGIVSMNLFIVLVNFIYETVVDSTSSIFHIMLFIAGAFLCQYVSINVMRKPVSSRLNNIGLIVYIAIGLLHIVLTPFQVGKEAFKLIYIIGQFN